MMKAYLTYGVGQGSKIIAMQNAVADANIDKIKITKLPNLEIERCEIIEDKKALEKLKGEFPGIVLQNCQKGEVAVSLVLGITENKILIGHGKAGGLIKAERMAEFEVNKAVKDQKLELEEPHQHISARAPGLKNQYSCAVVALVLVG